MVQRHPNTGNTYISLRAHGSQRDLSDIPGFATPTINLRVSLALDYVQNSYFCTGISFPKGDAIQAFAPHITGCFKDLVRDNEEKRAITFSSKCKIVSVPGACCSECNNLWKLHHVKRQRREKRMGIHRNCNKRYMTKEDVVFQLNEERKARVNAEKRERYWKEKFLNESVQIEEEDHTDLSNILRGVAKENLPGDIECLWEQQKKIMAIKKQAWIQMASEVSIPTGRYLCGMEV